MNGSSLGTKTIPAVPLRGGAVFPGGVTTISIGRKSSLKAAQVAKENMTDVLVLVQHDPEIENPTARDLAPIGILATVRDLMRTPQQGAQMLVELKRRVHFQGFLKVEPYFIAAYTEITEANDGRPYETMSQAIAYLEEYAHMVGEVNRQVLTNLRTKTTAGALADYIAGLLNLPLSTEIELLTLVDGELRLDRIIEYLKQEIQVADLRTQIQQDARDGAERAQREFLLREQIKVIRRELGEDGDTVIDELRRKIEEAMLPELVLERAMKELIRLERQGEQSAESAVVRNYLEWITDLPWNKLSEDNYDVDRVRQVLDEDHYGLDDVKERIVEFVAIRKLAGSKMRGAIINLDGPPGVGKTSIASSVARAMGREMARISLGGVRDEAEIRGHRRTYIGAIPGRIIRALRDVKTRNPIIVFDEIDKVGKDWRGDPAAALLEVLDPEQNDAFTDHYLELPFDLSQVIFITTSNSIHTIPEPLLDRMEVISMSGYIEDDKLAIANNYLMRKQAEGHGLQKDQVEITEEALQKIIRRYTYEAGVRQLERQIGTVIRKLAVRAVRGESGPFLVSAEEVNTYLGAEKYSYGKAEETDEVGLVTGLAATKYGGDITTIEVSLSEGSGQLSLTGSLGDVMKESAQTALTYARSHARDLGLKPVMFDKVNIHIHVPAGAVPKDGPSAGIALATAIISAFTNRPVRKDVAMTGEVTLRGKVLPIGGLRAKTIAALQAGIKTVLIPKENAKELPELPIRVREELTIIPVAHLSEVLEIVLLDQVESSLLSDFSYEQSGLQGRNGEERPIQA